MLSSLSSFIFVALLAPAGGTLPYPNAVLARPAIDTETAADTGTAAKPAQILLTTDVIASYLEVGKALKAYWAEHAEEAQAAFDSGKRVVFAQQGNAVSRYRVLEYATLVKQDTALAALFTKYHFDPSQYGPTEITVLRSIGEALLYHPVDLTTVAGKNIVAVRAHQQELADQWGTVKAAQSSLKMMNAVP